MMRMHGVHGELAAIDLNLLVALDALLSERHVTRAATRLGITQSAASHALARLRSVLGDPLLVRGPNGGLVPTLRAEALADGLRAALDALAEVVRSPAAFDPATARRSFRIGAGDYEGLVVLPRLAERVRQVAPGVDIWVHAFSDFGDQRLADGSLDVVLGPPRGAVRRAGFFEKRLFSETFTCVVRRGHPLSRKRLTLPRYCAASHLLVSPGGTPGSFVDDALLAVGMSRRIALAVPHFLVVPHVIAATDLIATLASRVAGLFAPYFGLVRLAPPLLVPALAIALAWHERQHDDPAHRWIREQIVAVARDLSSDDSMSANSRGRVEAKRRITT
jgi:DNA-binding transcriptional LysR family regulator